MTCGTSGDVWLALIGAGACVTKIGDTRGNESRACGEILTAFGCAVLNTRPRCWDGVAML